MKPHSRTKLECQLLTKRREQTRMLDFRLRRRRNHERRRERDRFVRNDVTRTLGCPIVERSRRDTGALAEARRFREKIDPSDGSPDFQGEPFKTILRNPTFHWITVSREIILSMRLQTLPRGICCVSRIPDCTVARAGSNERTVRGPRIIQAGWIILSSGSSRVDRNVIPRGARRMRGRIEIDLL